jgi:ATP-dependent Clp protease ATP-binding subunit ClpA
VVEKFVMQLEAQLAERQINIELSTEAADWLAKKGYDQQMGARPLARVIQEHVKKPLAEEVLFGKLSKGGTVRILLQGDGLTFSYLSRDDEKALPGRPARKALPRATVAAAEEAEKPAKKPPRRKPADKSA